MRKTCRNMPPFGAKTIISLSFYILWKNIVIWTKILDIWIVISRHSRKVIMQTISFLHLIALTFHIKTIIFLIIIIHSCFLILSTCRIFVKINSLRLLVIRCAPLINQRSSILKLCSTQILSHPIRRSYLDNRILNTVSIRNGIGF